MESSPRSPPDVTNFRMSRNGFVFLRAPWTIRIRPSCWTTNSRFSSPGGAVTYVGVENEVTVTSSTAEAGAAAASPNTKNRALSAQPVHRALPRVLVISPAYELRPVADAVPAGRGGSRPVPSTQEWLGATILDVCR